MSDTRGTQTDLVTDKNIADCLMELRSKAEFQDLSYRLSRSCTGEMTLTVTRDSLMGLLGAPLDPVLVTVTASAVCYVSVLFMPVEIINLKDEASGELNLHKLRSVLWKLTGRAGYGFCPGFSDSDFPPKFPFDAHGLQVLQQPFSRIQSPTCSVLVQQRRASSSRAASQPLQLKLCASCFETLTSVFMSFKSAGQDLSSVAAFAKFLPFSLSLSSRSVNQRSLQPLSKDKVVEDGERAPLSWGEEEGSISELKSDVGEGRNVADSAAMLREEEKTGTKSPTDKLPASKLNMRNCSVLLDRVLPGSTSQPQVDSRANFSNSSTAFSGPLTDNANVLPSSFPAEAVSPSPTPSRSSLADVGRLHIQSGGEGTSRLVLSARIKPFRKVMPHEQDPVDRNSVNRGSTDMDTNTPVERAGTDMAASGESVSEQGPVEEAMSGTVPTNSCATDSVVQSQEPPRPAEEVGMETDPPVLTPEMVPSPGSPQPLLIDEDAGVALHDEEDANEAESKRQCFRCAQCGEGFSSEVQLHRHISQLHSTVSVIPPIPSQEAEVPEACEPSGELEDSAPVRSCPICHRAFPSKEDLEKHLITRHRTRLHPCRYCGKKFALKKNLADHLQRHRGTETLICKECGQKFSKKKHFAAHVREHMGNHPYFCTICSRMFSREVAYEQHVALHRARRGVHAVLEGSQKTMQSIMTKAKKCLEEKALLTPAPEPEPILSSTPPVVSSGAVVPSSDQPAPSTPSLAVTQPPSTTPSSTQSTVVPASSPAADSLASSNLLLLSAVSLAQAQYDKQQGQERPRDAQTKDQLSVQIPASSQGTSDPAGSGKKEAGSGASCSNSQAAARTVAMGIPAPDHSSQVDLLVQQLNGPVPSSILASMGSWGEAKPSAQQQSSTAPSNAEQTQPPTAASSDQKTEKEREALRNMDMPSKQPSEGLSALTDQQHRTGGNTEQHETEKNKSAVTDKQEATPELKDLKEKEEKLRQKEEELKERERSITRKNMLLFQQLLMAHFTQQSKTQKTPGPGQGKSEKPTPQQALALINAMAARGAMPPFRLSVPAGAKAGSSHSPAAAPTTATAGDRTDTGSRPGEWTGAASGPTTATLTSQSGVHKEGGPPQLEAGNKTQPTPACPPPSSRAGGATPPSLPFRHPPQSSAGPPPAATPQTSAASATPASMTSKWKQQQGANLSQSTFFLQELMNLQSKMPSSAKSFLPPAAPSPVCHRTHLIAPSQGASPSSSQVKDRGGLAGRTGVGLGGAGGGGGRRESSGGLREEENKGRLKKWGAWSGGMVKEKLSSVPTILPLEEMQRLMSLSQPRIPVRAHRSPSMSPHTPSSTAASSPAMSSAASPAAPPSTPGEASASSSHAVVTSPSLLASAVRSPLPSPHHPQPSPVPSSISGTPKPAVAGDSALPSMPPLIPAVLVEQQAGASSRWPALHDASRPKTKEVSGDVEPMDLTKGNGGKISGKSGSAAGNRPATRRSRVSQNHSSSPGSESTPHARPESHAVSESSTAGQRENHGVQATAGRVLGPEIILQGEANLPAGKRRMEGAQRSLQSIVVQNGREVHPQAPQDIKLIRPESLSLLQHFLPAFVAQQTSGRGREGSAQRSPAPRFPPSAVLQMMPAPQTMSSVRGAVAGKLMPHITLQRPSLSTQSTVRPGTLPAPPQTAAVVTPASKAAGVVASVPSTNPSPRLPGGLSTLAAVSGSVQVSAASRPSLASPKSSASSHPVPQPVAGGAQTGIPHPQVSSAEGRSMAGQQQQQQATKRGKAVEKAGQAVNPLGGFAWHRPAPVHPDHQVDKEKRTEGGPEDREMSADQNLWQQQFLATLREKRRQRHEQQQKRQQEAEQRTHPSASQFVSPASSSQPESGRKRAAAAPHTGEPAAGVRRGEGSAEAPASQPSPAISHHSSSPQVPDLSHSQLAGPQTRRATGGRGGRARGKGRKRNTRSAAPEPDSTCATEKGQGERREPPQQEELEGSELRGFGSDGKMKVEPLEDGVRCDGCGHVFFNETDILEHDCDSPD